MKRLFLFCLVLLLSGMMYADRWTQARQEMKIPERLDLIRIEIRNSSDIKDLDRSGVFINQVREGYVVAEAPPQLLANLAKAGYEYSVMQENISNIYYENFFTESDRGRYLTYTEYVDTMHVMVINNPHICKLETLGLSHQSRLVLAMKISDTVNVDEAEPAVYFDGNIHGDEKISWAVCFEFIKYLLNNYGFNPYIANLINNREIWIVPMINPDGYVNNVRYNGRSVDLNRNFGWMYGNESNCGTDMFSENEATMFFNLFRAQPFVVYTTYHAGDSVISCPWSYTTYESIPEKWLTWHLAQKYSQNGNYYPYGQGSIIMYTINGASKDYTYALNGEVSWSIELCVVKTPPATYIDPCFNINKNAMAYMVFKAGQGIHGMVIDSITEQPLHAQVWTLPRNWLTYTSQDIGDFYRFYLPGTYTLVTKCAGYKNDTTIVSVPVIADSSISVLIKMVPDSNAVTNYAMRVIGSRYVTTSSNRTYPIRALGVHDSVAYQLDNTKWIVLEMAEPIRNDSGYDFTVFRSQGTGSATVKVSNNWKGPWTTIGTANAARTHFNLGTVSLDSAKYVRLEATSAFYLDAVEKYVFTVGIEQPNQIFPMREFRLQSNIVNKSLRIRYSNSAHARLVAQIYDINGRLVQSLQLDNNKRELVYDLKDKYGNTLKNGVYFIKAQGAEIPTQRFTIIR